MSIIAPSSVRLQIENNGSFKILKKTDSEVYAIECAMMTSRTSSQPSSDKTSNSAGMALPMLSKLKFRGFALEEAEY